MKIVTVVYQAFEYKDIDAVYQIFDKNQFKFLNKKVCCFIPLAMRYHSGDKFSNFG